MSDTNENSTMRIEDDAPQVESVAVNVSADSAAANSPLVDVHDRTLVLEMRVRDLEASVAQLRAKLRHTV